MQNKRTFANRFFELLRASLRLNTQRRSASSMCAFKKEERCVLISVTLRLHLPSARGFPVGNWLGLGSAWVSGQAIFSGYTANNYPRSTFDLVAFGGKNTMPH